MKKTGNPANKKNGCKGGPNPYPYTPELGDRICEEVKHAVRGLDYICEQNPDFPSPRTICKWLTENTYPEFSRKYEKAKLMQGANFGDEILRVAYNAQEFYRNGSVDKAKLIVDALKWTSSRLYPKLWAEKKADDEEKEERRQMTEQEIKDKLDSLISKAQERKRK